MSKKKQRKKQTDPKDQSKRGNEIFALVMALAALGTYGYGHTRAVPALTDALAQEKQASTLYFEAEERQTKARKGKKAPDGPEVKKLSDAVRTASKIKEEASLRVGITAGIALVLGFIGFIIGLVSLTKTKWSLAKLGKRLTQRVFGIAALLAGSAALYYAVKLLAAAR